MSPQKTAQMLRVYERFQNNSNLLLLSHTIDPKRDTPDHLRNYAKRNLFCVGEYWTTQLDTLKWYLDATGGRLSLFDVPLQPSNWWALVGVFLLTLAALTPLPGSEDHKILYEKNVWMDPDMNKYELEHVVTGHPKMTKEEWQGAYCSAWDIFYTDEHLETIMRRAAATGIANARPSIAMVFRQGFQPLCMAAQGRRIAPHARRPPRSPKARRAGSPPQVRRPT